MINPSSVCFVIVAAGSGSRFGSDLPKQFCRLAGRPVVMHAIEALRRAIPGADEVLVLSPSMIDYWQELCREFGFRSPLVVAGGATRGDSVMAALATDLARRSRVTAIHDGARPIPDPLMVRRVVEAAAAPDAVGAIPATLPTDSLRHLSPSAGSVAVSRAEFRAVQTPQAFPTATLSEAYRAIGTDNPAITDDASIWEAFTGRAPRLVEGSPYNIKITHPADLAVAEALIAFISAE